MGDNYYRPDLKKAALARLSAVHRSLKVAKSGVKKRNRQAVKTPGRKWVVGRLIDNLYFVGVVFIPGLPFLFQYPFLSRLLFLFIHNLEFLLDYFGFVEFFEFNATISHCSQVFPKYLLNIYINIYIYIYIYILVNDFIIPTLPWNEQVKPRKNWLLQLCKGDCEDLFNY